MPIVISLIGLHLYCRIFSLNFDPLLTGFMGECSDESSLRLLRILLEHIHKAWFFLLLLECELSQGLCIHLIIINAFINALPLLAVTVSGSLL